MSANLTSYLLQLSANPGLVAEVRENPEQALAKTNLTDLEKAVIRSRNSLALRQQIDKTYALKRGYAFDSHRTAMAVAIW